jgi:hypothetical protein
MPSGLDGYLGKLEFHNHKTQTTKKNNTVSVGFIQLKIITCGSLKWLITSGFQKRDKRPCFCATGESDKA